MRFASQHAPALDHGKPRRGSWACLLLLAGVAVGCGADNTVIEPGAVLLRVKCAPAAPMPDELRLWAWDDLGGIWDAVRFPSTGSLPKIKGDELGTILVQPNAIKGSLRVQVRGLAAGARVVDGALQIPSLSGPTRVFDILLDAPAIDGCPFVPPPDQAPCPAGHAQDAGPSGGDASNPAGTGGVSGQGGSTDAGGVSGAAGSVSGGGSAGGNRGGSVGGALSSARAGSTSGGTTGTSVSSARGGASAGGSGTATSPVLTGGTVSTGGTGGPSGGVSGTAGRGGTSGTGGSKATATSPPPIALPGDQCRNEATGDTCRNRGTTCSKHCGPENQGYKILTCTNGRYEEGPCVFSKTTDYACYSLIAVAACAATPPRSGTACSIPACRPCGSSTGTGYLDANNVPKNGYCVCSEGKWSCGTTIAWPCPAGKGC